MSVRGIAGALSVGLLVAASFVALPQPAAGHAPAQAASAVPAATAGMRILVRFAAGSTDAQRADAVRSVGGWVETQIPAIGVTRIALPGGADDAFGDGDAVAAVLAKHPAVASAELDRSVRLAFEPNDTYWATDPYTSLGQWGLRKAFVDKAWDTVRGSANVTVAILDTGVDGTHPDLVGALVPGTTFVVQPSSECAVGTTSDDNSHGTHVAGVVGATGNNGTGIAGVAFGVRIMPLKVLDCTGQGNLSDVANGMIWAVDHGARIVNLSLGSAFDSPTLRSAVTYATQRNVLVVSAVGNCGTSGDRCTSLNELQYPAAYPEVLAVGATDTDDSVAFFSSRNSTTDVTAPGRRIVSTTPTYQTYLSRSTSNPATLTYASFSGTSQAAPLVAGVAALIWSADPSLTATQVYSRITSTADDLGAPGRDDGYGFGRVNALRAVSVAPVAERFGVTYDLAATPRAVATGKVFAARVGLTNTSSFTWRAADPSAVSLEWSWQDPTGRAVAGALRGQAPLPADVAPSAATTVTAAVVPPSTAGTYVLRLDLLRGTTAFSTKGSAAALVPVVVGSGVGATIAPATAGTASFDASTTAPLGATVTNTGVTTWPAGGANPVRLSYHWLRDGQVVVWDGLRALLPADVPPGGKATLALPVMTPERPGTYLLRLELVQEGISWFSAFGVGPQDLQANVRSAYVASYSALAVPVLLPGGRISIPITVTNDGTAVWSAAGATPVRIAAHVTDFNGAVAIWDGARTLLTADVAPGASVRTDLVVDAPLRAGAYKVRADVVREGIAWLSSLGVSTGDADLLVAPDPRAEIAGGPIAVSRSAPAATVTIRNSGIATWTTTGAAPVHIGVHWYSAAGAVLVWDGPRTSLPGNVAAGGSVSVAVALGPPPAGAAYVAIDLVAEGVTWFGAGPLRPVTFGP
ncbi:MAG: S8 family serine peptidase [Chloroflexi bacterium]|nr:S8 family serine peptidase [Chloroflexota bacterium]